MRVLFLCLWCGVCGVFVVSGVCGVFFMCVWAKWITTTRHQPHHDITASTKKGKMDFWTKFSKMTKLHRSILLDETFPEVQLKHSKYSLLKSYSCSKYKTMAKQGKMDFRKKFPKWPNLTRILKIILRPKMFQFQALGSGVVLICPSVRVSPGKSTYI